MSMQRSNNANNTSLVILTATSTVAVGFSLYLWRSVARLSQRLDELEQQQAKQQQNHQSQDRSSPRRLSSAKKGSRSLNNNNNGYQPLEGDYPPPEHYVGPDDELPLRFLNAGKGDPEEGRRRFHATLDWRDANDMDTALYRNWPQFELIKGHYPHYFHSYGLKGEPVFYEQPPKTDLKALRKGGVDLPGLLKHYAMICEFNWQYVCRDDNQRSVYIIDLEGMGMYDFVGECKEFVHKASQFAALHYPERAGVVIVVNVPGWFKMVWNVVSKWVDDVTLKKIFILRGKEEILSALKEKIAIENIPRCYGGESEYELGDSLEERLLRTVMKHNNDMFEKNECPNAGAEEPCKFCNFRYARNY